MKQLVVIKERIDSGERLNSKELDELLGIDAIKSEGEALELISYLKGDKSIKIVSSLENQDILNNILIKEGINVSENSPLTLLLVENDENIVCENHDIVVVDGLDKTIFNSAKLQELHTYIAKASENFECKNAVIIGLNFLSQERQDELEEKLDELGSHNPERDRIEYSNIRELKNRLFLELKKQEDYNYKQLSEILDTTIKENISADEVNSIRKKYREENNYKEIYQQKRSRLINIAENLSKSLNNEKLADAMKNIAHRLKNQEFSIGVTGIIKAGKSTMMNALLKEDILGTAIRPETANLTVIKKSQEPRAVVKFWSEKEWNDIKSSAFDTQSKEFVETSESLGRFNNYIQDESKEIEIKVEELENYTSARKSENLCNLVKEVELSLPIEFLDGGVEIVDTPGIDDPIVQREIITLEYLKECSAILHLMNAKQSATQKDIEFIGDALIEQGISSLLVVITRIDTLGDTKEEIDKELSSIISHAKRNIETYLNKRSKDDISDILSRLEFLPLAGKFALQHRIGESQKALSKGYALEDTGILEIENYLNMMLFGENNPRATLAITNAYRTIEHNVEEYKKELENNYALIGQSREAIEKELIEATQEKESIGNQLTEIEENIKSEKDKIKRRLESLKSTFEFKFDTLRSGITSELSEYIINQLYKGEKPDEELIKNDVENKIKDFVTELRDWYTKQSEIILEDSLDYVDSQYANLLLPEGTNINLKIDKLDVMNSLSYSVLIGGIGGAMSFALGFFLGPLGIVGAVLINWWAGDYFDNKRMEKIEKLTDEKMVEVDKALKRVNQQIHDDMLSSLTEYDNNLLEYFKNVAMKPAKSLREKLQEREETLKELDENAKSQIKSDDELKEAIEIQLSVIEKNINQLKGV